MSGRIVSPTEPVEADLQPVDWQAVDNRVYDWLNYVLDMNDRIIWENLNEPQPSYPYLSLLRNTQTGPGEEERVRTLDANGDPIPAGGTATPARNEYQSYEPIEFTLAITAHVSLDAGGRRPGCDAMKMLSRAKASLGLRSIVDFFRPSGLSIVRPMNVVDTSVVVNAEWVRKATLDVIFGTASVYSALPASIDDSGFIDKVQLVSSQFGVDTIVDASS